MNAVKNFWSVRSLALLLVTLVVGSWTVNAAQPGGQRNGPKGNDWDEPMGLTLGQLAIKFSTKLTPPFIAHDEREAKAFLAQHIPPIIVPGGWDRENQQATVGDLMVILGQQLRLPVSDPLSAGPEEFYQALVDTTGTTEGADQIYLSFIGLWKDLWMGIIPTYFLATENMMRPARLTPLPRTPI
ncbi:MAG: hypothetical protein FJ388_01220 [Verrucomicrobia bacterium]|nr:hypothetical protein [Verrucomicrobiota bacterium]